VKKYPFSNKAMKAILAATIALSPVVTTGLFDGGERVEAATVNVDQEISNLSEKFYVFYKNAGSYGFSSTPSTTTAAINGLTFENISSVAQQKNITLNLSTNEDKSAITELLKNTATLIYTKHSSKEALATAVRNFRSNNAIHFNTLFDEAGTVTADQLVLFISDLEGELESAVALAALEGSTSYVDVIKHAVSETLSDGAHASEYSNLNGKLSTSIGLSIEDLFLLQDGVNNLIDPQKTLRSAMMQSAFLEKGAQIIHLGNNKYGLTVRTGSFNVSLEESLTWGTSSQSVATFNGNTLIPVANGTVDIYAFLDGIKLMTLSGVSVSVPGGGGGGTPPTDPPTDPENPPGQGGEVVIELPEGAAEVVRENNPSGKVDVVTKVSPEKVQEIVNLITPEKKIVAIKLEKAAEGEEVKANVPANLFTEAGKKNPNAVVEVQTDGASYRLPASEVKVSELAAKLGVNESEVQIIIAVNEVPEEDVKDTVDKNKLNLASKVIEFTVTAVSGNKSQSISSFTTFVEREITGDTAFNADQSVAVKLNEDGTFSAIPTLFNGNTATVKSLTNSKYTIVENDITFPDVNNVNWAEDYIETLASKYIIRGKLDGRYAPADDMTRAEFIVLLVRGLGLPGEKYNGEFRDVKGSEWFNSSGEVMAAVKYGITEGMRDGRFAPGEKITRIQAAAMVSRAMELKFLNYDKSGLDTSKKIKEFKDYNGIAPWARADIEKIYQAGIMSGTSAGKFNPSGLTKRDQMARILGEFLVSAKLMNDTSK
jgi:ribosomal protein L20A (L18A)